MVKIRVGEFEAEHVERAFATLCWFLVIAAPFLHRHVQTLLRADVDDINEPLRADTTLDVTHGEISVRYSDKANALTGYVTLITQNQDFKLFGHNKSHDKRLEPYIAKKQTLFTASQVQTSHRQPSVFESHSPRSILQ